MLGGTARARPQRIRGQPDQTRSHTVEEPGRFEEVTEEQAAPVGPEQGMCLAFPNSMCFNHIDMASVCFLKGQPEDAAGLQPSTGVAHVAASLSSVHLEGPQPEVVKEPVVQSKGKSKERGTSQAPRPKEQHTNENNNPSTSKANHPAGLPRGSEIDPTPNPQGTTPGGGKKKGYVRNKDHNTDDSPGNLYREDKAPRMGCEFIFPIRAQFRLAEILGSFCDHRLCRKSHTGG